MDNTQFTQQLAQFTSLEQLQSMNANLSALMNTQMTTNGLQAATLIGKQVQAQANTTQVPKQGKATPFQYTLAADSASVQIDVLDKAGNTVRTITARNQKAGPQTLSHGTAKMPRASRCLRVTIASKSPLLIRLVTPSQ